MEHRSARCLEFILGFGPTFCDLRRVRESKACTGSDAIRAWGNSETGRLNESCLGVKTRWRLKPSLIRSRSHRILGQFFGLDNVQVLSLFGQEYGVVLFLSGSLSQNSLLRCWCSVKLFFISQNAVVIVQKSSQQHPGQHLDVRAAFSSSALGK